MSIVHYIIFILYSLYIAFSALTLLFGLRKNIWFIKELSDEVYHAGMVIYLYICSEVQIICV